MKPLHTTTVSVAQDGSVYWDALTAGSSMPPHQCRVVVERAQLSDQLGKLRGFIEVPVYAGLPKAEQTLLALQADAMTVYLDVLDLRISRFMRAAEASSEVKQ